MLCFLCIYGQYINMKMDNKWNKMSNVGPLLKCTVHVWDFRTWPMCILCIQMYSLAHVCSWLQAIDSIHQVGLYCLALVPANTLPKTPLGGIHISDAKQSFLDGSLHPCNILMCPHTCVTNLPKPRQKQPGRRNKSTTADQRSAFELFPFYWSHRLPAVGVGPASVMVGNLVAGKRIAQAAGRDLGVIEDQDLVRKVSTSTNTGTHMGFFEVDTSCALCANNACSL